jgi:hypothetical protein
LSGNGDLSKGENILRKTNLHNGFFTLQTHRKLVGGDDHVEILSTGSRGDWNGNVYIGNRLPPGVGKAAQNTPNLNLIG